MILNDRADIIFLQVPLAKSICLSGTGFIIWKQGGLQTRGSSLRMTLFKNIARHRMQDVDTLGGPFLVMVIL